RNATVAKVCQVCGSVNGTVNVVQRSYGVSEPLSLSKPTKFHFQNKKVPLKKCRECRYMKCLFAIPDERNRFLTDQFTFLLKELEAKNGMRSHLFLNKASAGGIIAMEERTAHDWANHQMLTTMEYMKTFPLVHQLSEEDAITFIRKKYFDCGIFFMAMYSFINGNDIMLFPGGKDVFPEESVEVQKNNPALFNKIRSRLISSFIELKITEHELLILSVLICSDPYGKTADGKEISLDGRAHVESYRELHRQALYASCMLSHQKKEGRKRYLQLLGIINIVTYTMGDLAKTFTLFDMEKVRMEKLVKDFF
ncbi:hypothetical protein CAEBREN_10803, partial [Caenorhabditis brenneri]